MDQRITRMAKAQPMISSRMIKNSLELPERSSADLRNSPGVRHLRLPEICHRVVNSVVKCLLLYQHLPLICPENIDTRQSVMTPEASCSQIQEDNFQSDTQTDEGENCEEPDMSATPADLQKTGNLPVTPRLILLAEDLPNLEAQPKEMQGQRSPSEEQSNPLSAPLNVLPETSVGGASEDDRLGQYEEETPQTADSLIKKGDNFQHQQGRVGTVKMDCVIQYVPREINELGSSQFQET
ncbi:hypothetical protein Q7C36_012525 [Tachysurus vachellii]|uniref:Uncharacterized protein n=1 Tax=Tachysurus vachellii TaxID=175792 RepID=A0AA88SLP5_TACVA|nr:hypothetical protein Q7C36_012525 [Tachysurus vachellii]